MICKECGTVLPEVAKFCFNCGKTVESETVKEAKQEVEAEPIKEEQDNIKNEDKEELVKEVVAEEEGEPAKEEEVAKEEAKEEAQPQETEESEETEGTEETEEGEPAKEEEVAKEEAKEEAQPQETEETEETEGAEETEEGEPAKEEEVAKEEAKEEAQPQATEESEETEGTEETEEGEPAKEEEVAKEDNKESEEDFLDEDFKEDDMDSDVKEESQKESTDSAEDEEDEDAGFKYCIMTNPDYVPPEVEEEKPFFEEHIDYQGIYREKAEKFEKVATKAAATAAIVVAVVGIGYFGLKMYNSHKYEKSMEEANNLYVEKSYDAAIEKYNSALTMKAADKDEIALGLSKVYEEKGDTQQAIKVILDIYNETGNQDLYNEYQRLKDLSETGEPGETPNTNPSENENTDDNKAAEYDKLVAQINEKVDSNDMQAVIDLCRQAIAIDATREEAYLAEASIYSKQFDYSKAASVIQKGIDERNKGGKPVSVELANKLKEYQEAGGKLTEYEETFSSLSTALAATMTNASNLDKVINTLLSDTYKKAYSAAEVTYYTDEEGFVNSISSGSGMAIYSNGYVYYGDWDEGKRLGSGILVSAEKKNDIVSYYMYKGDWAGDLPNGTGTITYVTGYGSDVGSRSITVGSFTDGCEDGDMIISKTVNGTSWGKMEYTVKKGKPNPVMEDGKVKTNRDGKPIMGYYYLSDKATHIAIINESTKLVVNGLGLN